MGTTLGHFQDDYARSEIPPQDTDLVPELAPTLSDGEGAGVDRGAR